MSIEYFIGLKGPLPSLRVLQKEFATLGGAEGSWETRIRIGTSVIQSVGIGGARDDILDSLRHTLEANAKPPMEFLSVLIAQGSDDVEEVGEKLATLFGGVLVAEECELLCYATQGRGPSRRRAPAIDLSIPDEVLRDFVAFVPQKATGAEHLALVPETKPTVRFPALAKALGPSVPVGYPKYSGVSNLVLSIGPACLNRYAETSFWASEFAALGIGVPAEVFRSSFSPWHARASPQEWRALVAVICGLARNTGGVLYRPDASGGQVRYAFARDGE